MARKPVTIAPPKWVDNLPDGLNAVHTVREGWKIKARFYLGPNETPQQTFGADQLEAAKAWLAQQAELKRRRRVGTEHYSPNEPFEVVAQRWEREATSTQSLESIQSRVRKLSALNGRAISSIGKEDVQDLVASWSKLSVNYKGQILRELSSIFEQAIEHGQMLQNPVKLLPKKQQQWGRTVVAVESKDIWADAIVQGLCEKIRPDFRPFPWLGSGCGLRQGEIFGLGPEDIDWDNAQLTVNRQVGVSSGNLLWFGPAKHRSEQATARVVPVPRSVLRVLQEYMETYPPQKVTLPWNPGSDAGVIDLLDDDVEHRTKELFMVTRQGGAPSRNYWNKAVWRAALEAVGLSTEPYASGTHNLRHYFANRVLASGQPITVLAAWLGHADSSFTLRKYGRLRPDQIRGPVSPLEATMGGWV